MQSNHLKIVSLLALLVLPLGCGQEAMTRSEFKEAVIGKSPEEVIEVVGRPERTTNVPATPGLHGGGSNWYYDEITRDEISGNIDFRTQVIIRDGEVTRINF